MGTGVATMMRRVVSQTRRSQMWTCHKLVSPTMLSHSVYQSGGGAACSNPDTPPTPPDPPKLSNPAFCNLRFWGKLLAAKALEIFFGLLRGKCFFTLCVSTQNTQNFVKKSEMDEKHTKI